MRYAKFWKLGISCLIKQDLKNHFYNLKNLIASILLFIAVSCQSDYKKLEIGEQIPKVEMKDLDGKNFELSDWKGKPIKLHFWTITCLPCLAYFMEHERTLGKSNRDTIQLNICLDAESHKIQQYLEKYELATPNLFYLDSAEIERIVTLFNIGAFPHENKVGVDGKLE